MNNQIKRLMAYRIKMLRVMNGLTQQEIADRVSKSINAVSNWELGNTSPSIDDLVELCKIYEITPNQICGWEDIPELNEYLSRKENADAVINELKQKKLEIEKQIKMINDGIRP